MQTKKRIAILGSTGSIGVQTLAVYARCRDLFDLALIANNCNENALLEQAKQYSPQKSYCRATSVDKDYLSRPETYKDIDIVVNGIAGLDGLYPSLAVLQAGKILATANKESLVCFGTQLKEVAKKTGAVIRPVDSEHSTMWQCFEEHNVKSLIITASGGAFRDIPKEKLVDATAADALKHPNWDMGKKVTIDCATMGKKGREIIEAKRLFGIDTIIPIMHRESIVQSGVEMHDGTQKAGLSQPNMEIPIQYAICYPHRLDTPYATLDLTKIGALHFEEIDREKYPALTIAEEVAERDEFYATVFVAADEILVELYLKNRIKYFDIAKYIRMALENINYKKVENIEDVICISNTTEAYILEVIGG